MHADEAWAHVALAAQELGLPTDADMGAMRAITPTGTPPKEGDPIRFPNN